MVADMGMQGVVLNISGLLGIHNCLNVEMQGKDSQILPEEGNHCCLGPQ